MQRSWTKLDGIMCQYSSKLRDDLSIPPQASRSLASSIAADVLALPPEVRRRIRDDDTIGLQKRVNELRAFEGFMDLAAELQRTSGSYAPLTRAQVICQLYVVFVYLGDACLLAAPQSSGQRHRSQEVLQVPN